MMNYKDFYKNKIYKIGGFRKKAILDFILKDNAKVLDIGCGDGELGEAIKKNKNGTVYGIEISEAAGEVARKKIDKVFLCDLMLEDVPEELKKNKFDYIIITEVLEHLLEPEKLLERIKVLMDWETELIVSVPNILFWKNRFKIFFGNFDYTESGIMDQGHIHFFSWKSLQKSFCNHGYEIIETRHHIPTRGTKMLGKLFAGLFAFQFVVKAKRKRKVIYTAIFGEKDYLLEPKVMPKGFDFICFTDSDYQSDVWQIKKVIKENEDPVRCARKCKLLPHKYLSEYDISLWVDGNMLIRGDVNELIEKYLQQENLAIYDHSVHHDDSRNCVYSEAEFLIKAAELGGGKYKDDPELIKTQVEKYKMSGYPENNGLISSMVMLRKHNHPDVIKVDEDWWHELERHSRRDQLSFDYVVWKNKARYVYIKGDSRNNKYFLRLKHKIKNNYRVPKGEK